MTVLKKGLMIFGITSATPEQWEQHGAVMDNIHVEFQRTSMGHLWKMNRKSTDHLRRLSTGFASAAAADIVAPYS